MLAAVCVGTNDLTSAGTFYDKVLATLDMFRTMENSHEIGFGKNAEETVFYVLTPYNKQPATFGNGSQVMLHADSPQIVKAFYDAALRSGGTDDGPPGPRDYSDGYYGAYVRDIDGNKLHAFHLPVN